MQAIFGTNLSTVFRAVGICELSARIWLSVELRIHTAYADSVVSLRWGQAIKATASHDFKVKLMYQA
jgi:hypothetical protein